MPDTVRYAGLWPRFLALLVGLVLFCTAFFPSPALHMVIVFYFVPILISDDRPRTGDRVSGTTVVLVRERTDV